MMNSRQRLASLGALAAAVLFAAWRVYNGRSRERVASQEGLDDPEVARGFGKMAETPQMRLLRLYVARRAIELMPRGDALDLGCGPGHLVTQLAGLAPGLHVTGVDLSDEMLAEAESLGCRSGVDGRTSFRKGDAAQIPFPDGSLDLVVSTLSLHHWSDPIAVLHEIARVLRPGGAFLIFDLRRDLAPPFYVLVWFVTRCVVPQALRRVREPLASRDAAYTPEEAADLCARSGLHGWQVTQGPLWLTIEGTKA